MKAPDLQEKLQESEKLIEEMSKTWEEKLQQTERIHKVQVCSLANEMYNIRYKFAYWLMICIIQGTGLFICG